MVDKLPSDHIGEIISKRLLTASYEYFTRFIHAFDINDVSHIFQTDALIWVIDSADKRRLNACKDELHSLLQQEVN